MLTWKLCRLFVKTFSQFFPNSAFADFLLGAQHGNMAHTAGDWCRLKNHPGVDWRRICQMSPKRWPHDLIAIMGWLPMWSMSTDHFPILRNFIVISFLSGCGENLPVFCKMIWIKFFFVIAETMLNGDDWRLGHNDCKSTGTMVMMMMLMMIDADDDDDLTKKINVAG